jgi:cobalt-zinc-cadmium efflux system membrane fusion protein
MNNKNYIIAVAFAVFSLIAASCNREGKPAAAEAEAEILPEDIVELRDDQVKLAGIELGSIKMQALGNTIRANGVVTVTPQNLATVCMPMGGFIKSTSLLPGNYVSKGETLAVIENQEFVDIQQSYLEAMNRLTYAKAEYDRHTDLYKDDVYSEKNVQQVEVEYRNLAALVKSLEQKLLMIGIDPKGLTAENISSSVSLRSPISGYLSSVNVNIGKFVSPTEVLFEVVNSDRLYLELTLFEKDAEKAARGQKVRFSVNNGSREYDAVITQTGKSVGDDKTLKVFADVAGKCENLLPGMYVNASILETGNDVATLPDDAVVSFDDKNYIFVFVRDKEEDGKPFAEYRMVEVQKGVSSSGYTGIILPEGFDTGASKVVIRGAYNLLSAKKNAGEMAC